MTRSLRGFALSLFRMPDVFTQKPFGRLTKTSRGAVSKFDRKSYFCSRSHLKVGFPQQHRPCGSGEPSGQAFAFALNQKGAAAHLQIQSCSPLLRSGRRGRHAVNGFLRRKNLSLIHAKTFGNLRRRGQRCDRAAKMRSELRHCAKMTSRCAVNRLDACRR